MSLAQRVFVKLPASWQFELTGTLGRAGLLPHVPLARMFLRTLEYCGGDPVEIRAALRRAPPGQPSAVAVWRQLAASAVRLAERADSPPALARAAYLRAALYASVASWGLLDRTERARNQALVERYFEHWSALADPAGQALWLASPAGPIAAAFRAPEHARGAAILCHGFDKTKEWMTPFEAAAHEAGLATLSIDLPGMGASGVAGSQLRELQALGAACSAAVDWLQGRVSGPIVTFGVSGGGLAALLASAFDARVQASVTVGCPYSLEQILGALSAQQQRHYLTWTGSNSPAELRALIDRFALAPALRRVRARCLIVHGTRDEVVPAADARALAALLGPKAELRLLRGDDHMCTHALARGAAREWFGWPC